MFFSNPPALVLVLVLIPLLVYGPLRRSTFVHTRVSIHSNLKSVPLLARMPQVFLSLTWVFFCLALARPVLVEAHNTATIESRDIVISLDVSSSMTASVPAPTEREAFCQNPLDLREADSQESAQTSPAASAASTSTTPAYTRLDAAREAALLFVACRDGDRIGYQPFAERAYTGWPLTSDLQVVYTMISLAGDYKGSNTNFDGPTTSDGKVGALQAAINHFEELGHAESRVLVLVTDGEDSIVTVRFRELADQLRAMNVHIYVLGVGDAWTGSSTQDLRRFVEELGGLVIPVTDADQMREGFNQIDQLERSSVVIENAETYREIFPLFLLALALSMAGFLLSSALVREDM